MKKNTNASNPQYVAENILQRVFTAESPNQNWLTDVTEFHYNKREDNSYVEKTP